VRVGELVLEYNMFMPNEPATPVIVLRGESDDPESIVIVLGSDGKQFARKRLELEYP
jgi:hypothetical protein